MCKGQRLAVGQELCNPGGHHTMRWDTPFLEKGSGHGPLVPGTKLNASLGDPDLHLHGDHQLDRATCVRGNQTRPDSTPPTGDPSLSRSPFWKEWAVRTARVWKG